MDGETPDPHEAYLAPKKTKSLGDSGNVDELGHWLSLAYVPPQCATPVREFGLWR